MKQGAVTGPSLPQVHAWNGVRMLPLQLEPAALVRCIPPCYQYHDSMLSMALQPCAAAWSVDSQHRAITALHS